MSLYGIQAGSGGQSPTLAVIVAGGKGVRMKSGRKKQYISLLGIPVLVRTLMAFDAHPGIDGIILVVPEPDLAYCRDTLVPQARPLTPLHLVTGGLTRQDSVSRGLARAKTLSPCPDKTLVLIHDGVRPFVSAGLVDTCMARAKEKGACIPALAVTDTVKEVDPEGKISGTLDRRILFRAQTPQAFRLDLVIDALDYAVKTGFEGTDEASLLEHAGIPVFTVPGEDANIKLTTPQDLILAQVFLEKMNKGPGHPAPDQDAAPAPGR